MLYMQYDKSLVIDILDQIIDAIETVQKRCAYAKSMKNFFHCTIS